MRAAAEVLDVHAEGARGGDAAGGGVGLFEQACVGEFCHLVAHCGGAHAGAVGLLAADQRVDHGG